MNIVDDSLWWQSQSPVVQCLIPSSFNDEWLMDGIPSCKVVVEGAHDVQGTLDEGLWDFRECWAMCDKILVSVETPAWSLLVLVEVLMCKGLLVMVVVQIIAQDL
jgi:hypothetical protein